MKKIMVALLALAAFCGMISSASAAETELSARFVSQYLGESGWVYTNHAGMEYDATIFFENGISLGAWVFSNSQESLKEGEANEVDLNLIWLKDVYDGIMMDVGVSYYNYVGFGDSEGDSWCFHVGASKTFELTETQQLTPSIKFEGYMPVKGDSSEEHGADMIIKIEHSWDVGENVSLYHAPGLFFDDGQFGGDDGVLGSWEVGVSYAFSANFSADASWKIATPLSGMDDGRGTESVLSAGLTYAFQTK